MAGSGVGNKSTSGVDVGSGSGSNEINSPSAKRQKVSSHKQQQLEVNCAEEVRSELDDCVSLFCNVVKNTKSAILMHDKDKTERKFKRLHRTSILSIAHLRNARDLLQFALNKTSYQMASTSHSTQTNRNQPKDNSSNQSENNCNEQQSSSPAKMKVIMETTETSPSMVKIQKMNRQIGVFSSYVENLLICCNMPIDDFHRNLANLILVNANENLVKLENARKAIEDEFDNKLDQLSDQNPFPIYMDDVQISNEEKDLIREKRKHYNDNTIAVFLHA